MPDFGGLCFDPAWFITLTCWDNDPLLFTGGIEWGAAPLVVVPSGVGNLGWINSPSTFGPPGHTTVHRRLPAGEEEERVFDGFSRRPLPLFSLLLIAMGLVLQNWAGSHSGQHLLP